MDKMPLISLILYSIPESYLIFTFGLIVIGQKTHFSKIILPSIISALASLFVRMAPLPFGIHSIIGVFIVFILFKIAFQLSIRQAILATITSFATLLAIETAFTYILELNLHLRLQEIWKDPILRTFLPWPQLIIYSILAILLYKKRFA